MESIYRVLGVPFGFILTLIFGLVQNYGLTLIIFTFLVRLIMVPSAIHQQKGAAKTQRLQPKLRRINERYATTDKRQAAENRQKIQEETQALYAREGHNPMNQGCLPMFIQFPIMFGLIGAIYNPLRYPLDIPEKLIETLVSGLTELNLISGTRGTYMAQVYVVEYIEKLQHLFTADNMFLFEKIRDFNFTFLGLPMGQVPSYSEPSILWIVPILSFLSSFATTFISWLRQRQTNPEMAKNPMMGCMTFGMPLFSLVIAFQFPVGIGIYWTISNLFALGQTLLLNYTHSPKKQIARLLIDETVERRSREENLKLVASKKNNTD